MTKIHVWTLAHFRKLTICSYSYQILAKATLLLRCLFFHHRSTSNSKQIEHCVDTFQLLLSLLALLANPISHLSYAWLTPNNHLKLLCFRFFHQIQLSCLTQFQICIRLQYGSLLALGFRLYILLRTKLKAFFEY